MRVHSPPLSPPKRRRRVSPNEALIVAAVLATVAASLPAQLQFLDATATRMPVDSDDTAAVVLADVDGDGDLDLLLGNATPGPGGAQTRLYVNDGTGRFLDETSTRMPARTYRTSSLALGDVDGDGDLDIVLGNHGEQNQLYTNYRSTGTFSSTSMTLPFETDDTNAVALGDVDGDGDLDIVFGNGTTFAQSNKLYLNRGPGIFTDTTGSGRLLRDDDLTAAVALVDLDGDGDLDLVTGNGGFYARAQNRLYFNNGSGRFSEVTEARMPTSEDPTDAVALGDVDGDGDLDMVFGNIGEQNRLYLNDGTGRFTDATAQRMPPDADFTNTLALGDVDGDGDLDLVVGNGRWLITQRNRLYLNDGSGTFADVTASRMPVDGDITTAVALGDVDADRDLDVVFGNSGAFGITPRNRVYVNLLRQLDAPFPARLGAPYQLDVYARHGRAANGDLAYPMLASATANIPLPPFGTLFLEPSGLVVLPPVGIPQPAGVSSLSFSVPNVPGLVGATIYAQAVLIQQPMAFLTNLTADGVLP